MRQYFSFSEDTLKILASDIERQNGIIPCKFVATHRSYHILIYQVVDRGCKTLARYYAAYFRIIANDYIPTKVKENLK